MEQQPVRYDLAQRTLGVLVLAGLIVTSLWILRPFLPAVIWATTLVIATWPLMLKVERALGGRRYLAVGAMTGAVAVAVLLPLSMAIGSIVRNTDHLLVLLAKNPVVPIPPPPKQLGDLPMVGGFVLEKWQGLADNGGADIAATVQPFIG